MIGSTAVLYVVVAIAWVISAEKSEVVKTEANTESLHPSSRLLFESSDAIPTATATLHPGSIEGAVDIQSTSRDTIPVPTLAVSIATPQTNIEIASTPISTPVATSELLQTPEENSTVKESFASASHPVNSTHRLSSEPETSIGNSESVLPSLDGTHYPSLDNSIWTTLASVELETGSTPLHSTLFESTPTSSWSNPTITEGHSSATASQITPSKPGEPTKTSTTESTSTPKSVTDRPPAKSTSAKSATSAPKSSRANSNELLTPGAKIAVGVIVTLCILGVILAAVVLYRRFNLTHRSLKSFLTSGVRYKTYKNATYKDDEVVGDVGIVSELT